MTTFEMNDAVENAFKGKIEPVAAYIRVSTTEQKLHGLSLAAQEQKLRQYAEDHNMRIVEWYRDEGVSGRKLIRRRPELQRLIKDAQQKKFSRIIFIKLDRFFRSVSEYYECMRQIEPVVWTATEEEYDLTTANGRMLVNMKLTVAELEADTGGERIRIVNDYKVSTGQPLNGIQTFGWTIGRDEKTGLKNVIRDPEVEEIMYDLLEYYKRHQSKSGAIQYLYKRHHIDMTHQTLSNLLANSMLYGAYRDNPKYCQAYITKEEFDEIQEISSRNIKDNTSENRVYLFTGLMLCPECGRKLHANQHTCHRPNKKYKYSKYICQKNRGNKSCSFNKNVFESTVEKLMLENIERYMEEAKVRAVEVTDGESKKLPKYNVEEIHGEIDRLNYSWRTGKIRSAEQYEADYAELMEKLEKAEEEQAHEDIKDFSKVEGILHEGWREIYNSLDMEYKRAFWRSFVASIEIDWSGKKKEIKKVNFF